VLPPSFSAFKVGQYPILAINWSSPEPDRVQPSAYDRGFELNLESGSLARRLQYADNSLSAFIRTFFHWRLSTPLVPDSETSSFWERIRVLAHRMRCAKDRLT
jgi:hypothetical protein